MGLRHGVAAFPPAQACRGYLAKLRWPEGFGCPICGEPDHWVMPLCCGC